MKYIIDKNNRPVYLQLYQQIREDIIKENYPCNTKLPSKRNLAEEVGVSTITVEHAYELLCDEGYVEARERSGYVVIFRKSDGFAAVCAPTGEQTSHSADHTYPDFPLSVLSKTMRKVLTAMPWPIQRQMCCTPPLIAAIPAVLPPRPPSGTNISAGLSKGIGIL